MLVVLLSICLFTQSYQVFPNEVHFFYPNDSGEPVFPLTDYIYLFNANIILFFVCEKYQTGVTVG